MWQYLLPEIEEVRAWICWKTGSFPKSNLDAKSMKQCGVCCLIWPTLKGFYPFCLLCNWRRFFSSWDLDLWRACSDRVALCLGFSCRYSTATSTVSTTQCPKTIKTEQDVALTSSLVWCVLSVVAMETRCPLCLLHFASPYKLICTKMWEKNHVPLDARGLPLALNTSPVQNVTHKSWFSGSRPRPPEW